MNYSISGRLCQSPRICVFHIKITKISDIIAHNGGAGSDGAGKTARNLYNLLVISPEICYTKPMKPKEGEALTNTERIAEYIAGGCTGSDRLGVEIEHFVLGRGGAQVTYNSGIQDILNSLAEYYTEKEYSCGELIALCNDEASITIEPAGQLEISIKPCRSVSEIDAIYRAFTERVQPALAKHGFTLAACGYTPRSKAAELELIPKERYAFMDRHFKGTGTSGINMMRATASTQVSVDFSDEADCVRKLRLSSLLAPVLALITDNSPVFEGEPYAGRMLRTRIWQNVDPVRCGTIPCLFDEDMGFLKYAEYVYNSPPILIMTENGAVYTGMRTAAEIYEGRALTEPEIVHLLSMFFPDVRLKRYIEIRPADSLPRPLALGYAALIRSLLIKDALPASDISGAGTGDIENAKSELMEKGYDGVIYGRPVREITDRIFRNAEAVLSADDAAYLAPLKERVYSARA